MLMKRDTELPTLLALPVAARRALLKISALSSYRQTVGTIKREYRCSICKASLGLSRRDGADALRGEHDI